jgi:hypothetical protein
MEGRYDGDTQISRRIRRDQTKHRCQPSVNVEQIDLLSPKDITNLAA